MGYDPLTINAEQYTTYSVINELRPNTNAALRAELALENRKIIIHDPSLEALEEVEENSKRFGDHRALSKADKDVLATALELSKKDFTISLISDDYAIQNIAESMGLKYISLTTFGIRYHFKWIFYCPACKRKYTSNSEIKNMICEVCGTQLKRRVRRKKKVEKKMKKSLAP